MRHRNNNVTPYRTVGPVTKTTTAVAAAMTIIVWLLELGGVEVPAEVASAGVLVLVFIAGFLVPHHATQDGDHEAV